MDSFQIFILLMFAATILVGLSQKLRIPYPIGLILGGTALGFGQSQYIINFDPHLILVVVLPPILYYAAFGISQREFKRNLKEILSLALGLVMFTTFVIGMLFKWFFPEFSWALCFAFGAILSPPDAIAATTILKRFAINTRLLTVLEGESLINDAGALILYNLTITALLTGTFSLTDAGLDFFKIVLGGLILGFIFGYLLQNFSVNYLEPAVGVIFSFTIPYITYILANYTEISGVLAVVVNGLVGSQALLRHSSSLRRVLGYVAWDIFIILINCFVFILIGLQLRSLTSTMSGKEMLYYSGYAVIITVVMIAIRILWALIHNAIPYAKARFHPTAVTHCSQIVRESLIIGWSGMRGIVSLTAALALPYTLEDGLPLTGRNEVIFITFVAILLSLLIPGLSLSLLIKKLKIEPQPEHHNAIQVRLQLKQTAEKTIEYMHTSQKINDTERDFLITYFNLQLRASEATHLRPKHRLSLESAKSRIIQAQRQKLLQLWESFEVDDKLLNQLEHELDLEETHHARAELK